jgi:hypothetical protein
LNAQRGVLDVDSADRNGGACRGVGRGDETAVVVGAREREAHRLHRAFGELRRQRLRLAFADHGELHLAPDVHASHEDRELFVVDQELVVELVQDVELLHAGLGGGAVRVDTVDDQPDAGLELELFLQRGRRGRSVEAEIRGFGRRRGR